MTYEKALHEGRELLKNSGITEYETDGFLIMSELLGITRTQYFMQQKDIMPNESYDIYMKAVNERCSHKPLQYITGKAYFMGYEFKVNENVLIPRMDTETLVIESEKLISKYYGDKESVKVLDMCTGSGCIAVSLALRNPKTYVTAVDISDKALETAVNNADILGCKNVTFISSDLFDNISDKYDIIISNPPYIRTDEINRLMEEVRCYEPYGALDGCEDGLFFYRKITQEAASHLNENGVMCYEIGCDQAQAVTAIMEKCGFKNCNVIRDLAGLDRVVTGNL